MLDTFLPQFLPEKKLVLFTDKNEQPVNDSGKVVLSEEVSYISMFETVLICKVAARYMHKCTGTKINFCDGMLLVFKPGEDFIFVNITEEVRRLLALDA